MEIILKGSPAEIAAFAKNLSSRVLSLSEFDFNAADSCAELYQRNTKAVAAVKAYQEKMSSEGCPTVREVMLEMAQNAIQQDALQNIP